MGIPDRIAADIASWSEIGITIGNKPPGGCRTELLEQCRGSTRRHGDIIEPDELHENLRLYCIPDRIERWSVEDDPTTLAERRKLMAQRIKAYFGGL